MIDVDFTISYVPRGVWEREMFKAWKFAAERAAKRFVSMRNRMLEVGLAPDGNAQPVQNKKSTKRQKGHGRALYNTGELSRDSNYTMARWKGNTLQVRFPDNRLVVISPLSKLGYRLDGAPRAFKDVFDSELRHHVRLAERRIQSQVRQVKISTK